MTKVLQCKVKLKTFIANGSLNMMFIVRVSEQNDPKERATDRIFVFTGKWFSQACGYSPPGFVRSGLGMLYFWPEEHFD